MIMDIEEAVETTEQTPGFALSDLRAGDILEIQTEHTLYTMTIRDPAKGEVIVTSNGNVIRQETYARILGTTLTGTGTFLKVRSVLLGYSLCIFTAGYEEIIFSPTVEARVNGKTVLS